LIESSGLGVEDIDGFVREVGKSSVGEAEVDGDEEAIEVEGCRGKREL
jgi:hypothetical protein